ncbi:uncharacterized protein LOC123681190 [Harmonia axyridis]|uniref:uncharacterized protein LOC123681190 n=1 Tax=Harmonia axyridis TaxID=115357 RepID=UPI001E279663|nr:uncharacterized protein LOC123681190 [Harmonia axyridis]
MNNAYQELIILDKVLRFVIGKLMFPTTVWCDKNSAGDCTKKDGSPKLKVFDDHLEVINDDLLHREKSGLRRHMAETHGDFIKQCVEVKRITVRWIPTKENVDDLMIKPSPSDGHKRLTQKLMI